MTGSHRDRPFLVVNPSAGSRRTGRTLPRLLATVEAALGPVDVALTGGPGHAEELARRATGDGRRLLVAVGGDGTLHEVVNGVLGAAGAGGTPAPAAPQVGVIAVGTGADFGRSLDLPRDLRGQLEALASGRERTVDVARASFVGPHGEPRECYFVNILSAGPGGLVDLYVRRMPRVLGGRAGYLLASLAALARCPRARLRCVIEGDDGRHERELSTYLVGVCNGRVFGGGMRLAPMAEVDDGRLEVILVSTPDKQTLVRNIPTIYRGTHLSVTGVEHFGCRRIELELLDRAADERFWLDVDGEPLGRLPLSVEVVPAALNLRV
jgi:YegS/Rv2252/BmrU family lipid kinase